MLLPVVVTHLAREDPAAVASLIRVVIDTGKLFSVEGLKSLNLVSHYMNFASNPIFLQILCVWLDSAMHVAVENSLDLAASDRASEIRAEPTPRRCIRGLDRIEKLF